MPGAVSDERVSHADQRAELRQLAQQGPSRSPARLAVCAALLLGCWVCVSAVRDIARRSPTRTALVGEDIPLSAMMGGDSLDVFGNPSDDIKPPPKPPATSFSLPATGSFTGHSHSVPGGPFTIGSGTYFVSAVLRLAYCLCVLERCSDMTIFCAWGLFLLLLVLSRALPTHWGYSCAACVSSVLRSRA